MMDWNYDLAAMPRGCEIVVLTITGLLRRAKRMENHSRDLAYRPRHKCWGVDCFGMSSASGQFGSSIVAVAWVKF